MLRWYYSVDASTVLEITDRIVIPLPSGDGEIPGVGTHAEEGSGWVGNIFVEDRLGELFLLVHRRIYCVASTAPAGRQVVGNWFIQDLDVEDMDPWNGVARKWIVTMADQNSLLERRKFVGADSVRPEEDDITRIRWLLTTTELNTVDDDETYIDTAGAVTMSATDYKNRTPSDVLRDCNQQSLKNFWVMYREDMDPNRFGLWYAKAESGLLPAFVAISNDPAEIDADTQPAGSVTVFPPSSEPPTRLNRQGGRSPASGVIVTGPFGQVYVQDTDVGDTYVYRDVVMPTIDVKTTAIATARAIAHGATLTTPDDEVETEIFPDEEQFNDVMAGSLVSFKKTNFPNYTEESELPGYATGTQLRISRRTLTLRTHQRAGLHLWGTPVLAPGVPFAILYGTHSGGTVPDVASPVYFGGSGDDPQAGYPPNPTVGPITIVPSGQGAGPEEAGWFEIDGTGTVNLHVHSTVAGVPLVGDTYTMAIRLNNVDIASDSIGPSTVNFFWGTTNAIDITVTDVEVVPGDVLTLVEYSEPRTGFFVPAGVGDLTCNFTITGGSLTV